MTTTETIIVSTGVCPFCGKRGHVDLTHDQHLRYMAWKEHRRTLDGKPIQVVLNDVPMGDREQLMSSIHGDCYAETFPPEEE